MKMDSSFTDEDEEERVAPLAARLAKKMKQGHYSKTLPIHEKEDKQVSIEDKKIEKKRDLDLSVKESSTEPLKKKVKQESGSDKEMIQSSNNPQSELDNGPGVLSSVGNLCGSAIHPNHTHRKIKQKDTKSAVSVGKGALSSCAEKLSVLSSYKTCMTEKSSDGLQSKHSVLSNHKEPFLCRINDSTKDGSLADADSSLGKNLQKESKLTNDIKQNVGKSDERGQKAKHMQDSTFADGKIYLGSTDRKVRGMTEDQKRAKERHVQDHTLTENGVEDVSLSLPSRPSKGKQLVTKNGKVKSKWKGSHERESHSSKDERGIDEARSKREINGNAVETGYHGDESDGDTASSPVFKKSKNLRDPTDGNRDNSRKVGVRISSESELSGRNSRHLTHEKLNLERKYPTSPKSSKGRGSCIHSNHRIDSKLSHNQAKDVESTSQRSHHRDERFYGRDKKSLSYHRASKPDERRMRYSEYTENTSVDSSSSSVRRSDEKPTSSPRYNKFLHRSQKSPKLTTKDFSSRSSGDDSVMTSSEHHKEDKHHKRHSSQEHNLPSTERVSPFSESVRSSGITSSTQFKKSHRSKGERNKIQSSEVSNSSLARNNHLRDDRKRSLRSRHDKSDSFSQGARSDCRFATRTLEVSVAQDSSTTSQNNSRGYDIGGIATSSDNSEESYVHDITSPDVFSDEDGFIEEVDVITSGRGHRRRGSSQGNRQSVTEIIDDDDSVILLDDETGRNSTPPDRRRRESGLSIDDGGNITPRTAAAINQLEADEAMARRLQLEFDREETYVRTPPQPEELGMTENFHPGEGQFAQRIVHSYIPELYSNNVITFGMEQGMMPWFESIVETRTARRGGNQRGRGNRRRRQHIHIEHLYHQAEDDYERLLELEEQLGPAVSQGLPPEILTQLPTFKFTKDSKGNTKEDERSCTICMADYQVNENLRRLPCFHAYHRDCIDRWFQNNSACPICRVRVELG